MTQTLLYSLKPQFPSIVICRKPGIGQFCVNFVPTEKYHIHEGFSMKNYMYSDMMYL